MNYLSPSEIADFTVNAGIKKANLSALNQFILGILAGAFIAFGAQASNMATHTIADVATAKLIGGLIFPAGLILVLMAGAELFTGNNLMILALCERKITLIQLLRSWVVVYAGNLVGSVLIAILISWSGQLNYTGGLLGAVTIKAAAGKVALPFFPAVVLGVLCNGLVCLAVWTSFGAKDGISKAVCVFFPIWTFVASGFEHSVANMYYIAAGIFAKCNPSYVAKAIEAGASQSVIDALNWSSMFTGNLIPVTLGNIIGGAGFVGLVYWFVYKKK
ncbi:MAG: formate/nitrite transporter family protein [Synergistaceae bacterium]|nr:formate/nitrite transporter family protein [Synergistaceae bacterium]